MTWETSIRLLVEERVYLQKQNAQNRYKIYCTHHTNMTTQSVEVTLQPGATMFEFKAKSRPERIQIYDFIGCICQNRDFQGTLCGIAAYQPTGIVLRLRLSNRRQIVLIEFPYYAIHQPFYEVIRHAMPWTAQCLMSDTEWLNDQLPIIRPLDVFDGLISYQSSDHSMSLMDR